MANRTCRSSFGACALRAARLDVNGVPLPGANRLYVSDTLIQVTRTINVRAGSHVELPDGCGGVCASIDTPDLIESITLEIELCQYDAELYQLLTGGTLITLLGETVGHLMAAYGTTPPDTCFEVWAQSVTESGQDLADNPYIQFGWPKTQWIPGNETHDDANISRRTLSTKVYTNANFYNGPGNDWMRVFSTAPEGYQFVDALPAVQCGYKTLSAS